MERRLETEIRDGDWTMGDRSRTMERGPETEDRGRELDYGRLGD